jgi:hypothetical protein
MPPNPRDPPDRRPPPRGDLPPALPEVPGPTIDAPGHNTAAADAKTLNELSSWSRVFDLNVGGATYSRYLPFKGKTNGIETTASYPFKNGSVSVAFGKELIGKLDVHVREGAVAFGAEMNTQGVLKVYGELGYKPPDNSLLPAASAKAGFTNEGTMSLDVAVGYVEHDMKGKFSEGAGAAPLLRDAFDAFLRSQGSSLPPEM